MRPVSQSLAASLRNQDFSPIPELLQELRQGRMIVVCDDHDRENEGDLIMAAEFMTAAKMAFIIRHTGGVVCLALTAEKAAQLDLPPMVAPDLAGRDTAFTVSIDAACGIDTGISAADRAQTVLAAANPRSVAADFVRPGHIFPLRARPGGVLERSGHTEATVDLCRLAGLQPCGVLSEVLAEDGSVLRGEGLRVYCRAHAIKLGCIADLRNYRHRYDTG